MSAEPDRPADDQTPEREPLASLLVDNGTHRNLSASGRRYLVEHGPTALNDGAYVRAAVRRLKRAAVAAARSGRDGQKAEPEPDRIPSSRQSALTTKRKATADERK